MDEEQSPPFHPKSTGVNNSQKFLLAFLAIGILFFIGSLFSLKQLTMGANFLLIPSLILYYRSKARNWFKLMILALVLFYIRDVLLFMDPETYPKMLIIFFIGGLIVIYGFAVTGFQKSRIYFVECISLLIMYGFLGFLFYTVSDLVDQVVILNQEVTYLYLLLLTMLLAITFTEYLIKSHYASLWLMLASASLLVSELSLFFRQYIIDDLSVRIFFPLFHVIAYYAFIEHALYRRRSNRIPYF